MLKIHGFTFNPFQENTYLIINEEKECFIVDPGCYDRNEEKMFSSYISENGLKPIGLLNTHCHIDHVFGNQFVLDKYGLTPLIHPAEEPVLQSVTRVADMYGLNYAGTSSYEFYEGDHISLGKEELEILHLPGHAPGHIGLYHEKSGSLVSGDVLFRMSIGRTDLPGGNFEELIHSIRTKVFTLPDETRVYPGHMESTTVGYEKKHNPFFSKR